MSKSIKLKNNTYLDSNSIVYNHKILSDLLPHYLYHYDVPTSNDLDTVIEPGIYRLSNTYVNAPVTTTMYGALIVITSKFIAWTPEDKGNWLWQFLLKTTGEIYVRQAINETTFTEWKFLNEDSGWKNLPLASGVTVGTLKKTAQYRKIGKIVQLRGDVGGITARGTTVATLPEGYRPSTRIDTIQTLSGIRFARVFIETNGKVIVDFVSDGVYNSTWYNIDMTFMVT